MVFDLREIKLLVVIKLENVESAGCIRTMEGWLFTTGLFFYFMGNKCK